MNLIKWNHLFQLLAFYLTKRNSFPIRQWADHYYVNDAFQKFRQGIHTKTFTIIINEGVQETLKIHLRNMTKTERTPLKFMSLLNDTVLRKIIMQGLLMLFTYRISIFQMAAKQLRCFGILSGMACRNWCRQQLVNRKVWRQFLKREAYILTINCFWSVICANMQLVRVQERKE